MTIYEVLPDDPYEGYWNLELVTNEGTKDLSIGRGEPEDMCIARDLSDVYHIKDLLIMAYNAGKNGEKLEVNTRKEEVDNDLG